MHPPKAASATTSMSQFNPALPSIRNVQTYIREKRDLQIKLLTGDTFRGQAKWIDDNCLNIETPGKSILIWLNAIAYIEIV